MAILIDPPAWPAHGTLWSHLVSDSDYDELHAFAARLRIPRRGFDLDHYDVPASMYEQAIAEGALAVTAKDVVHSLRRSGLRVRQAERETVSPVRRRQYLLSEWAALGEHLGVEHTTQEQSQQQETEGWQRLGDTLIGRWNEPHRAYHDERHLEDVLLSLDQLSIRGERLQPETLLAAWFHDAVYTGSGGSDEHDSAQLAAAELAGFGFDSSLVQLVGEMIVATTPAIPVEDPPAPLAQLLDADLSIFASSPHRYEQYAVAVRTEYAHVPDGDFAEGRARILETYLQQAEIYRTITARQLWEQRARLNLEREIELLRRSSASSA